MCRTSTIRLGGGAELAYASYGSADGVPLLHFHGHPGSRLEGRLAHAAAVKVGVRLICPDRPGMGRSTFDARRALLDWPETIVELADALSIDRFAVQGVSGGGPYALACAFRLPARLTACTVLGGLGPVHDFGVGGMMPINRMQFTLARWASPVLRPAFWAVLGRNARLHDDAEALDALAARMVRGDGAFVDREMAKAYVAETLEAFRQGSRGAAYDAKLYARPWGFRLEDIEAHVHLWHGEDDRHVPVGMARQVARAIPRCTAKFFAGEDHMAVILGRMDEALAIASERGRER